MTFETDRDTFIVAICPECGYYHSVHPTWIKLPEDDRTLLLDCPHCGEETYHPIKEARLV